MIKSLVEAVDHVRCQDYECVSEPSVETEKPQPKFGYIYYSEPSAASTRVIDSVETMRKNETIFASFAVLAKKYLSFKASSAACERLFSLSGHIFSCKRRKLNIRNFLNLVFLKLNEKYL